MNAELHVHDVVALLEDVEAAHPITGQPLTLRRGQVGTVIMTYDGRIFEIEFSGRDGQAYAILPIKAEKLMVLREVPEVAAA